MAASREGLRACQGVLTDQLGIEEGDITEEASFRRTPTQTRWTSSRADHGARGPVRDQDLGRGRKKITTVGRAVDRLVAPVAAGTGRQARAADRRAAAPAGGHRVHARVVGGRADAVVRAAGVPRRQRARARGRARAVRAVSGLLGGTAGEESVARRLAGELCRGRARGSISAAGSSSTTRGCRPTSSSGWRRTGTSLAALLQGGPRRPLPRARVHADRGRDRGGVLGADQYALTTYVDHKTELQEPSPAAAGRSPTSCAPPKARRTNGISPVRRSWTAGSGSAPAARRGRRAGSGPRGARGRSGPEVVA